MQVDDEAVLSVGQGRVMNKFFLFSLCIAVIGMVCAPLRSEDRGKIDYNVSEYAKKESSMAESTDSRVETAVLAGGCFWCIEAVYERINGIKSAVSGYTGGQVESPSYREVTSGATGHAEAVLIEYDPSVITYEEILEIFWRSHDPTTLNRQGADVGTQYRSAIYYADDNQREIAEKSMSKIQESFDKDIVTEISSLGEFYFAEDYHQDYFDENPTAGYCRYVIAPKLQKLGLPLETHE